MLDAESFTRSWRTLMGVGTPLTEENVRLFVNRRDDMQRLTAPQDACAVPADRIAGERPPGVANLLQEIDWCLENGNSGFRTKAALAAAGVALSGGRAITSDERTLLQQLAERYRVAVEGHDRDDSYARLERYVASLLAVRISPEVAPALQS
jgi:hypothetical protein